MYTVPRAYRAAVGGERRLDKPLTVPNMFCVHSGFKACTEPRAWHIYEAV